MTGNKISAFRTVAIMGNRNSGKTTVFEEITGCFAEKMPDTHLRGYYYYKFNEYEIFDLPFTYDIETASKQFDLVIYVIDATKLGKDMFPALKCSRMCKKFIVLVNFCDKAKK
ncbi:MAG: 50S ribosome-binding GTPase [Clostridiales bacterium]|nr:50S ribosome-binding GTPase [Clostridiales bacterium]